MNEPVKIDEWQVFIDSTHGRARGDYYDSSECVETVADDCLSIFEPIGPWEPLGNGEWRRPLRKVAK